MFILNKKPSPFHSQELKIDIFRMNEFFPLQLIVKIYKASAYAYYKPDELKHMNENLMS